MLLCFAGCNGDDEPVNQLKGMWKASDTEYYSFHDTKIFFYEISNYGKRKFASAVTGNYVYDKGSQNIYVSTSGESAILHIEKMDRNSLVLKNIKENEVFVLNRHTSTIKKLPEDLTGYTLHYKGLPSLTVHFDTKSQFRILNPKDAFIVHAIADYYEVKELGYSYKKTAADKATLTLNYSDYIECSIFLKSTETITDVLEITHSDDFFVITNCKQTSKYSNHINNTESTSKNEFHNEYGVIEH